MKEFLRNLVAKQPSPFRCFPVLSPPLAGAVSEPRGGVASSVGGINDLATIAAEQAFPADGQHNSSPDCDQVASRRELFVRLCVTIAALSTICVKMVWE